MVWCGFRMRTLCLALAIVGSSAAQAVFKCSDTEGNVTFSQTPCPKGDTAAEVDVEFSDWSVDSRACELAGMYSQDAASRMRSGSDYSQEVARYGGRNGRNAVVVGIVNYVYSFRATDAPAPRIGALTKSKCLSGGLGRVGLDDLPVDEYFNYDPGREIWVKKSTTPALPSVADGNSPAPEKPRPHNSNVPPGVSSGLSVKECEKLKRNLRDLDSRMRSGYAASDGESLRDERRSLKGLLDGCKR